MSVDRQVIVYADNIKNVSSRTPLFIYYGGDVEGILKAFHEMYPLDSSVYAECYTHPPGMIHRALCKDRVPLGHDTICITVRVRRDISP